MTIEQAAKELYYWSNASRDNFHAILFSLIQKSDPGNRERLRLGFPEEVRAFEEWSEAPSPKLFFDKYGVTH